MPIAPIWIALSLALSAGQGGVAAFAPDAMNAPAVLALAPAPAAALERSPVLGEEHVFTRRGRRNPFEPPCNARPELGKRLSYQQQMFLVRQAGSLLEQIRLAHGSGDRAAVLARYDEMLQLTKYRFGIEEIRNQLLDAIQTAQSIVADATTAQARELLVQIKADMERGRKGQALWGYRALVAITSLERFTDPALRTHMETLRSEANQSAPGLAVMWARELSRSMDDWMEVGQFHQVIAASADIVAMLKEEQLSEEALKAEAQGLLLNALRLQREAELQIRFNTEGVVLSAVVYTPTLPTAIVNGRIVYEGDDVMGMKIAEILPGKVVFVYHGQKVARSLAAQLARQTAEEPASEAEPASAAGTTE